MIRITGDIHGVEKRICNQFQKSKAGDVILQLGDFGFIFTEEDSQTLDFLESHFPNVQMLWIDGNHQNFARLYSDYEIVEKYGAPVHKIRNNIYHLMRGNIYTIKQKTFFVFGGATSIDKCRRIAHVSWWPEEMPSTFEYETGLDSLQKVNYNVDYILTHCSPGRLHKHLQKLIQHFHLECNVLNEYLDTLDELCTFKKWFIGHYHIDNVVIQKKYHFLFRGEYYLS